MLWILQCLYTSCSIYTSVKFCYFLMLSNKLISKIMKYAFKHLKNFYYVLIVYLLIFCPSDCSMCRVSRTTSSYGCLPSMCISLILIPYDAKYAIKSNILIGGLCTSKQIRLKLGHFDFFPGHILLHVAGAYPESRTTISTSTMYGTCGLVGNFNSVLYIWGISRITHNDLNIHYVWVIRVSW